MWNENKIATSEIISLKGAKITVLLYFQDFHGFEPHSRNLYFLFFLS